MPGGYHYITGPYFFQVQNAVGREGGKLTGWHIKVGYFQVEKEAAKVEQLKRGKGSVGEENNSPPASNIGSPIFTASFQDYAFCLNVNNFSNYQHVGIH